MERYTVFDFTLPNGKPSSLGYSSDYVAEYDLKEGGLVRVFPDNISFKIEFGVAPSFEGSVMCRIMSMRPAIIKSPLWNNVPCDAWLVHLASTEVTSMRH
ncbi:MAG TPA: hypothetical protein VJL57_03830 [Candidatus Paceibacterota bacterium]